MGLSKNIVEIIVMVIGCLLAIAFDLIILPLTNTVVLVPPSELILIFAFMALNAKNAYSRYQSLYYVTPGVIICFTLSAAFILLFTSFSNALTSPLIFSEPFDTASYIALIAIPLALIFMFAGYLYTRMTDSQEAVVRTMLPILTETAFLTFFIGGINASVQWVLFRLLFSTQSFEETTLITNIVVTIMFSVVLLLLSWDYTEDINASDDHVDAFLEDYLELSEDRNPFIYSLLILFLGLALVYLTTLVIQDLTIGLNLFFEDPDPILNEFWFKIFFSNTLMYLSMSVLAIHSVRCFIRAKLGLRDEEPLLETPVSILVIFFPVLYYLWLFDLFPIDLGIDLLDIVFLTGVVVVIGLILWKLLAGYKRSTSFVEWRLPVLLVVIFFEMWLSTGGYWEVWNFIGTIGQMLLAAATLGAYAWLSSKI
ncbi:MAG: hypothetical protein ACFFBD_05665 [Candidatus Hodarchaeota archaeon]